MADSDKPAPKKVNEKETNQPSHTKTALKPAAKKVPLLPGMSTEFLRCICNDAISPHWRGTYCYVHHKFYYPKGKRDELIAATQADVEDEIIDSSEAPAAPVAASKKKKATSAVAQEFPEEDSTVFKWADIQIGKRYKCMSFGNKERHRTQKLLVPIDDF